MQVGLQMDKMYFQVLCLEVNGLMEKLSKIDNNCSYHISKLSFVETDHSSDMDWLPDLYCT